MAKKKGDKPTSRTLETCSGSTGRAKKPGKSDVRARAMASDLLTANTLNDRQERIGTERRKGGPDLDEGEASRSRAKPGKVEATELDD